MFILMSAWSENLPDKEERAVANVPKIIGRTMSSAGVAITITSLTDFLAFAIGSASVFPSVTNFSLYAGQFHCRTGSPSHSVIARIKSL
jgi:hypothetical protein